MYKSRSTRYVKKPPPQLAQEGNMAFMQEYVHFGQYIFVHSAVFSIPHNSSASVKTEPNIFSSKIAPVLSIQYLQHHDWYRHKEDMPCLAKSGENSLDIWEKGAGDKNCNFGCALRPKSWIRTHCNCPRTRRTFFAPRNSFKSWGAPS